MILFSVTSNQVLRHHLFCTDKNGVSKKAKNLHHELNPPPLSDEKVSLLILAQLHCMKRINHYLERNLLTQCTECDPLSKLMSILAYDIWNS